MKRILIPALIALGLTAAACGTEQTAAGQASPPASIPASTPALPASEAMNLGGSVQIASDDGPVDGTVTVSELEITTRPGVDYGEKPQRGYFLIFTVKLSADKQLSADEYEFYVATKNGEHIDQGDGHSIDATDYDKVLGSVELNTGEHTTGLLVFDSPSQHGTLNYAPNYQGGPIASWTF